ncbi:LCP family protein [Nocardia sp. NPDC052254]|uniref:LCP family glycopolymer transferase n=1 Tax=Nocardia sp. NPDC052254 TaxID=3155681 RepID=UPI0034484284
MGDDDRRGRASRPGGRAPWERYPGPESGENAAAPRNRRTDEPKPTKQLTVQDLVQRVDSERTTRRRKDDAGDGGRKAPGETTGRPAQPERGTRQPGKRSRATDDAARPAAPTGANRAAPRGGRNAQPPAAPPARGGAPRVGDAGMPADRGRTATPPARPGRAAAPGAPANAPRPAETGATPRSRKGADPRAAQSNRAAAPEQTTRGKRPAPRRPGPDPHASAPAPALDAAGAAAGRAATGGTRTAAPASEDAQPTTVYRAPGPDTPPDRQAPGGPAPVPEQVTDQLPMPDDESGSTAASSAADADPEEKPKLSRLAASRQRRSRRVRLAARSTSTLCAVVALLATGIGWNYLRATDNSFTQVSALDGDSGDVVDPGGQTGDENFLIVGTDTRAGVDSSLGAGTTEDAEGARSDTVMMVHIPKDRSRVVAVSFPRDLDVSRPECAGWDNDTAKYTDSTFPAANGDKLNATYALGGPKCLTNVIRRLSGLKINHFVGIDFSGFQSMVDTIGGVEVCTNRPLVDDELGTVLPNPGRQILNGPTALDYVRARHVQGEERSDYDRIHRQQLFLSSLLRSALSSKVLFDIGKLNGFIGAFSSHAFMDNVSTKDLLMLGRSMQKMSSGAITFLTVPTAGTTSYGNEIPRESDIKAIFQAIIDDQPLPGEKKAPEAPKPSQAPTPPQLSAVDPSTVSVQVSNGSGQTGIAGTAATRFGAEGFQIYNVGNYSGGTIDTTTVRYSAGHEAEAATVASALPGAKLASAPGLGSIVEVALGADFSGTVGTPAEFGSPVAAPDGSADAAPVELPSDLEHVNAADDQCK